MTDTLSRPLADRVGKLEMPQFISVEADVPQAAQDAAIQALADGKTHYTDRPGIVPLREWVAQYINDLYGFTLDKDEVTITCGLEEAIFTCVMVLAESAIFVSGDGSHLHGAATLKNVPMIYSIDDLQDGTLIYLTNTDSKIQDILEKANPETCWIVWEETPRGTSERHPALNEKWADRTVTIDSMENPISGQQDGWMDSNQNNLAGWRIGWMAGSEMAGKLRSFKQSMTICSPSISQWAAYGLVSES